MFPPDRSCESDEATGGEARLQRQAGRQRCAKITRPFGAADPSLTFKRGKRHRNVVGGGWAIAVDVVFQTEPTEHISPLSSKRISRGTERESLISKDGISRNKGASSFWSQHEILRPRTEWKGAKESGETQLSIKGV